MISPYVLIDRDGTLIAEKHYLSDPDQVELLPGCVEGLRYFDRMGMKAVVITNQSGVGRGYFTSQQVDAVHERLRELLKAQGVEVHGFYICPHTPEMDCECRKPKGGLAHEASRDLGFDPAESVVIGDKQCDMELGRGIGARTILVRTGYGRQHEALAKSCTDYVADDLLAAALIVETLRNEGGTKELKV